MMERVHSPRRDQKLLGRQASAELNQKLLGRQARSETDGAVFEKKASNNSSADMVWNQVTASQFTPRHEDLLPATRGREETSGSFSHAVATGGGTGGQRSASPPGKPSQSSPRRGDLPPAGDRAAEELSATVDELRKNVERERERSRQMEKRAAEAEFIAVWLKEELDKSVPSVELDGTQPVVRAGQAGDGMDATKTVQRTRGGVDHSSIAEEDDLESTRPVLRRGAGGGAVAPEALDQAVTTRPQLGLGNPVVTQPKLGLSLQQDSSFPRPGGHKMQMTRMPSFDEDVDISTMDDPRQLREELIKSHSYIELKQHEVISLEEQNLVLREELNHEKQKVIELKRAANTQKEESQKANGDLEMNHWLQEEVALLRNEAAKLQEKLEQAAQREEFLKSELADLRSAAGRAKDIHSEEMGRLSVTVGDQLVQVERELAQRTRELSEATEPFLKHAHGLLAAARKAVVQIEGASGRPRQAPPLYDLRSRDLPNSFRSIVKLLKYMVEVLAQHTGMANPFERGGECYSACDTAGSLASSMQDFSQAGSQNRGLLAPSDVGSQRPCGREKTFRNDQEPFVEAREVESISKRWSCYLQE